ncbi:MAG: hypothetical protein ABR567_01685 [Myxococcales bacterium]|nr:hypothetical protein [Myxococcales bacterium]
MKLLAGCALALYACGGDLASPFSAVAITFDVNKQAFKLAQVRLNSLSSLRHLRGSAGDVTAGGKVRVSSVAARASGATVESLRSAFIKTQPSQVEIAWNVLNDIVYPEDFASLELLSTYYNMEKARAELANLGLTTLPARPIVAHAELTNENGISPLPDGELYYAPMATFFAPATTAQQAVPPAFNLGAVAHALGHQAVEELVWGGTPLPSPETGTDNEARHIARALSEGVGDYLGVAVSNDPHWFDHSLQVEPAERALDQIHCSSQDMLDALPVDDATAPFDPYPLGSVIASALWEEASATTAQNTSRGVLAALGDLGTKAASGLTLAVILDTLAAHSPDDQRADLCDIFFNRFEQMGIKAADLPSCGKAPLQRTECQ